MKKTLLVSAAGLAMTIPAGALAQVDDEIVVTATKREQTLQEVPVAVDVIQEETLEQAQIIDVFDLQSVVPSLRVSQNQTSNQATFTIRGFGNGANNLGIEPSVGVFIDGVYRSRSASAISDLVDIERVEVLRGPQSTLFGKNASAGVISVVTQEPQFEFGGKLEATVGNYDQRLLRGYVTGPLTETLAYSLSGTINKREGYATNVVTGTDINDRDRWAVRGQMLFEPTDTFSVRLFADYDELDEVCCYAGNLVNGPTSGAVALVGGQIVTDSFYDYQVAQDIDPVNDIENRGVSGTVEWDLGFGELTSITAYRQRRDQISYDADFTSADIVGELAEINQLDTFTQEIRIAGATERLGWLAGLFYFDEEVSADSFIAYGEDFRNYANALSGGGYLQTEAALIGAGLIPADTVFGGENQYQALDTTQENRSFSVFGQVDFDVTDRLTLTAGLNYTDDSKEITIQDENTFDFSNLDLNDLGNTVVFATVFTQATGGAIAPTQANIAAFAAANPQGFAQIQAIAAAQPNPFLPLVPLQFLPGVVELPNSVENGEIDSDNVSYTLRAAYDVTDQFNLYASYATGYKAPSVNLTRDTRPFPADLAALGAAGELPTTTTVALGQYVGTRFAEEEISKVFEIGAKARFDWGSLNVALFDQVIEDFQSNIFQGTGFVLANAGEQSVTGAEVELNVQPSDRWDIRFAGTFLDPEYDEFVGAPGPNGPTDLSGTQPAGIPEVATSTAVTYMHPIETGTVFARMDWDYQSSVNTADNLDPSIIEEREVSQFNGSLGVNFDGGFEAMIWGRNLFNDEYLVVAFPTTAQAGSFTGYPNPPRTYGITVRKNF